MGVPARSDGMEAGYLESPFGPLFCCYHPPRGGTPRDAAVLFCDPFGSDRMNLHRAYRAFALHLSALGFPVLRIDHPGTCDSAGYPRDPGHFRSWLASLHLAADFLRERSGASELGLFGALVGGTLATVFAAERADATALALWGPVASGRAFVRELTAFRRLTAANPNQVRPMHYEPGDIEAIGFLATKETVDELSKLDLYALRGPIVRAAAIFPRSRSIPVDRLAEHLRTTGARVDVEADATFDTDALVNDKQPLPRAFVEAIGAFFAREFPERDPAGRPSSSRALAREVVLQNRKGVPVRESVATFGADGELFGIVTESLSPVPADRPAILLVNGGHNHRAGINRNYTEWARDWAALGLTVMRMDIRGLGDSPVDPSVRQVLYRDATQRDLSDAMDHLTERHGARRFVALGLCAGGYQSFQSALRDSRIVALAMLNPLRFERMSEEAPLRGGGELNRGLPVREYLRKAIDPAAWKRLVVSRRDPRPIVRTLARKAANRLALRARRIAFALSPREVPPSSWLSEAFLTLTRRGCDVLVVFAAGDAMEPVFDEQTGPDRGRLDGTGRFRVERVPDADHIFSPIVSQERVERLLREAICRWAAIAPREHRSRKYA